MRDHYHKFILPNINTFHLTARQKHLLRPAAGGKSKQANGMMLVSVDNYLSIKTLEIEDISIILIRHFAGHLSQHSIHSVQ